MIVKNFTENNEIVFEYAKSISSGPVYIQQGTGHPKSFVNAYHKIIKRMVSDA